MGYLSATVPFAEMHFAAGKWRMLENGSVRGESRGRGDAMERCCNYTGVYTAQYTVGTLYSKYDNGFEITYLASHDG